ncbi:hypothetical protein CJ195_02665 [Bacillus sp. UMB0899]|uniref:hypothetical protein n=1 Tax=Metabacillus schmidteae TaxID=2730405 RepID=UPI000C80B159|nr:hypothetical protein [Metabacillus schmidteae]PMC40637.1 hypothetical protein CJ195_02665 [Bacillus sp. UMB0899]
MGRQPTFFVLDDKMVAVFSVEKDNCTVTMECLFSKTGIEDYTLEYQGPIEKKSELMNLAIEEAQNIFEKNILTV